jgi:hypothetical protein
MARLDKRLTNDKICIDIKIMFWFFYSNFSRLYVSMFWLKGGDKARLNKNPDTARNMSKP